MLYYSNISMSFINTKKIFHERSYSASKVRQEKSKNECDSYGLILNSAVTVDKAFEMIGNSFLG